MDVDKNEEYFGNDQQQPMTHLQKTNLKSKEFHNPNQKSANDRLVET
jgi:hypothetical protein